MDDLYIKLLNLSLYNVCIQKSSNLRDVINERSLNWFDLRNDRDKLFSFGSGPSSCVGERMMWLVLKFVAPLLVKTFVWEHRTDFPPDIKYLPVARPRKLEPMILRKRNWNHVTNKRSNYFDNYSVHPITGRPNSEHSHFRMLFASNIWIDKNHVINPTILKLVICTLW